MSHRHGAEGESRVPTLIATGARRRELARETRGTELYASYTAIHDDPAPDYRKYAAILIKQRWLIAGVTALSLAVGLVYTLLQTPVYRASATIQIERQTANISGIAGLGEAETGRGGEFYQTQYELLKKALARFDERIVISRTLEVYAELSGVGERLTSLASQAPSCSSAPEAAGPRPPSRRGRPRGSGRPAPFPAARWGRGRRRAGSAD